MTKVCEWDPVAKMQRTRDMTPAEEAQRLADIAEATRVKVPLSIPMLNAHLAMIEADWFDDVEAFVKAMPGKDGKKARAFWDKAHTMRRDNTLVQAYATAKGKTSAEVDALFIAGAALDV